MADPEDGKIYWHCPEFRAVVPLDGKAKLENRKATLPQPLL